MADICETAKAKVNLDLRVVRRRRDGYHDLDSLVVFPDFGDRLVFSPADDLALAIEGPFAASLAHEQDNLVLKAARDLARLLSRPPNVHITLEKHLPVASGIGGGSADAAATLRGLVRFWDLSMTLDDLTPLAASLGADVPVCLASRPAHMTGIGDRLTPFEPPDRLSMLLINPGTPVGTPAVFKQLDRMSGERISTVTAKTTDTLIATLQESANDLEAPARRLAPVVDEVLAALAGQDGCRLARLSGSGATCFGLFRDDRSLTNAASHLRAWHPDWWIAPCFCQA